MVTLEEKNKFLKNKANVRRIILSEIKKDGGIIFGARSVNKQVPKHLRVHTEDYDVLVKGDPKKVARRIERRLDKKFKGNFFKVQPAQHPGTETIKNNLSGKTTADLSKLKEKIPTIKRGGVRFARLSFQEKKIRESLADPASKFRHQKDRFTRDRIKLARKQKTKRRRPKRINKFSTNFGGVNSMLNVGRFGI